MILGYNIVNIFFALIAMMLGINYPDIDLKTRFLSHRSMITHSPLLPFLLYYFSIKNNSVELEYFVIGFSLAVALHLIFDFFPKAWIGSALIKPSLNGITFSKFFILFSISLSYYLSFKLMRGLEEFKLFLVLSCIFYVILAKKEESKLKPLFLFIFSYIFIGNMHYPSFFKPLLNQIFEMFSGFFYYIF